MWHKLCRISYMCILHDTLLCPNYKHFRFQSILKESKLHSTTRVITICYILNFTTLYSSDVVRVYIQNHLYLRRISEIIFQRWHPLFLREQFRWIQEHLDRWFHIMADRYEPARNAMMTHYLWIINCYSQKKDFTFVFVAFVI